MTIEDLRQNFEHMAYGCKFDIDRMRCGEYKSTGRNTQSLWNGYWQCAVDNGVITGHDAHLSNKDSYDLNAATIEHSELTAIPGKV